MVLGGGCTYTLHWVVVGSIHFVMGPSLCASIVRASLLVTFLALFVGVLIGLIPSCWFGSLAHEMKFLFTKNPKTWLMRAKPNRYRKVSPLCARTSPSCHPCARFCTRESVFAFPSHVPNAIASMLHPGAWQGASYF